MPPQNQQPPMMQSMHYPQMVPPEIGQQPDLWDHDKHVSSIFCSITSQIINTRKKIINSHIILFSPVLFSGLVQMDKLV